MKKYNICMNVDGVVAFQIDAKSSEEARDIAFKKLGDYTLRELSNIGSIFQSITRCHEISIEKNNDKLR